jgi:SAM-dependent methyltransferase
VLDLGCGSGLPITKVLIDEGLNVHAVDASPTLVQAFRKNFPETPVLCEAVEDPLFFERAFDGGPLATPEAIAREPAPFPSVTRAAPLETGFADWRRRLTGNLSRRSDGRWTPLTRTHGVEVVSAASVADEGPGPSVRDGRDEVLSEHSARNILP